ncbi:MAG: vitamin B12 dependent methionine synthase [bacterium]
MKTIVLDRIPFTIDREKVMERAGVLADTGLTERLIKQAGQEARPKAMYRPAFINGRGEDHVEIEGVRFQSRVLAVNLENVERVFPFVATCGAELEAWPDTLTGREERYFADRIKELAYLSALKACFEHMDESFGPGRCSVMNPGSLEDWPLSEQRPLFELLGDPEEAIGVKVLPSLMMYPSRTTSGIRFPSEVRFESCMLCPRESCPLRKAPYDPELFEKKFKPA